MNLAATVVTEQKSYVHLTASPPLLTSALTGQCSPDLVAIPKMAPGLFWVQIRSLSLT